MAVGGQITQMCKYSKHVTVRGEFGLPGRVRTHFLSKVERMMSVMWHKWG